METTLRVTTDGVIKILKSANETDVWVRIGDEDESAWIQLKDDKDKDRVIRVARELTIL